MNINNDFRTLLTATQKGDAEAFAELYNKTAARLRAVVYPYVKNDYDAEDILQEVYIAIYNGLPSLKEPEAFWSWSLQICRTKSLDYLRTKKRHRGQDDLRPPVSDENEEGMDALSVAAEWGDYADPQVQMDAAETKRLLDEIIGELPESQRLCILLWKEQLSTAEIASALDMPKGTVNSNVNYAKKKIKDKVQFLEKQGTKLYGLAPIPFFLWLLSQFETGGYIVPASISAAAGQKILDAISHSSSAGTAGGSAAAEGTAAGAGSGSGMAGATSVGGLTAGKVAAIAAAAVLVIGGGGTLLFSAGKNNVESTGILSASVAAVITDSTEELLAQKKEDLASLGEEILDLESEESRDIIQSKGYDGLTGELLYVTDYTYENDNLVSEIQVDSEGRVLSKSEYSYDEEGHVKELDFILYDSDESQISHTCSSYDSRGNIISFVTYKLNGGIEEYCVYSYSLDKNGRILSMKVHHDTGGYTVKSEFAYDGNTTVQTTYNLQDEPARKWVFERDENGRLVYEEQYDDGKTLSRWFTYGYDEQGNLTDLKRYTESEDLYEWIQFSNKYKAQGEDKS